MAEIAEASARLPERVEVMSAQPRLALESVDEHDGCQDGPEADIGSSNPLAGETAKTSLAGLLSDVCDAMRRAVSCTERVKQGLTKASNLVHGS